MVDYVFDYFQPNKSQQRLQLGVALARRTGQEDQEAARHLFQRVSLDLMKGNAALFLAKSLDEDQIEARVDGRQ